MTAEKPWHEEDSFWELWESIMFTPQRIADAKDDIEKVIELTGIKPEGHILDLCCGIGRHSHELARRGFRVTGVDRTATYLGKARKTAEEEKLDIEFLQGDMREFIRPGAFDGVINMYTSFTYFEDPEEDKKVIENAFSSLKPGGVLVVQTHGKETLAKIFNERNWEEYKEQGVIVLQERTVSNNWNWMENRWILLKGNERIENRVSHRVYAGSEMVRLLERCGFSRVVLYGDLDGRPYDQNARMLITIGYK